MADHAIPLVDISPHLSENTTADAKASVIDEVKSACSTYGFLQIQGHGVPLEAQQDMLQCCKTLFDLPQEQKDALSLKNSRARRHVNATVAMTCCQLISEKGLRADRRADTRFESAVRLQRNKSFLPRQQNDPWRTDTFITVSTSATRSARIPPASYVAQTNGPHLFPTQLSTFPRWYITSTFSA